MKVGIFYENSNIKFSEVRDANVLDKNNDVLKYF